MMEPVGTFDGGRRERVQCVAVSPDGRHLLAGSRSGTEGVDLWRLDSGALLHNFPMGDGNVTNAVAFSPDGAIAVSASNHADVRMWNVETRQPMGEIAGSGFTDGLGVAFPRDGAFLLSSHGRMHTRYTLALQPLQVHDNLSLGRIFSPSLSPDGRFVATLHFFDAASPNLVVYDLLTDMPSLNIPPQPGKLIGAVAFSPVAHQILIGNNAGEVKILDAATGGVAIEFAGRHAIGVNSVAFSPDGTLALSGSGDGDGVAKVWNAGTGAELASFVPDRFGINGIAVTADNRLAVTGSGTSPMSWDLSNLVV
jgi:WD40 repeat protein